jgi:anti-anti-sigma factor
MQIQVVRDGPVAIVVLDGLIDTRAAQQFEKQASALLDDHASAVVVDFDKVPLVTSAGIRVLFMMGQRLRRTGGALVLCCLSARVRSVFEVAKLLQQFRIVETRAEAVAQLATLVRKPAPAAPPISKLSRLVGQVLLDDGPEPDAKGGGKQSALTTKVLGALKGG